MILEQNAAYGHITVYLYTATWGYVREYMQLDIEVCSDENIVDLGTANSTRIFMYDKVNGATGTISDATIQAWYVISGDHQCDFSRNMFQDTLGASSYTHASITYQVSPQKFDILQTNSVLMQKIYLVSTSVFNITNIPFYVEVCGLETITHTVSP